MFCPKCGKKISNETTFCPYCGKKINDKVENLQKPMIMAKKAYQKQYIILCLLTTLWLVNFGCYHVFQAVEKYNGNGLEYIYNRAMPQLLGAFIGITGCCIYEAYKNKISMTRSKILIGVISSVISQITCFIGFFFYCVGYVFGVTNLTDVEMFEKIRFGLIIVLVILSALCIGFGYIVYKQGKMGIRTKSQEFYSGIVISGIIAIVETFVIWKVLL